jgi:hypothetical protein
MGMVADKRISKKPVLKIMFIHTFFFISLLLDPDPRAPLPPCQFGSGSETLLQTCGHVPWAARLVPRVWAEETGVMSLLHHQERDTRPSGTE